MDRDYHQFVENVKRKTGIDLSLYKEAQMKRRLTSLRERRGYRDFQSFFKAISENETLFNEFLDRMTINVSEFFRNAKRWEVLEKKILPRLFRENKKLKVWSAACSTGEEPYTLAIILNKFIPFREMSILATDIDKAALERAKQGVYLERALKEVPRELVNRYFQQDGACYRIKEEVKQAVHFQQQNLLSDPFGTNFDLIVCRNVMIYFTEEAKHELYHKFSRALRTGGVLFVGSTEQIIQPAIYQFEAEEMFFYKKVDTSQTI